MDDVSSQNTDENCFPVFASVDFENLVHLWKISLWFFGFRIFEYYGLDKLLNFTIP